MKILILGAGQVGFSVAQQLAGEANDITVIDRNTKLLAEMQDRLDIRTVHGHAANPEVLRQAGAEDTELVVAVTNSDETNMVACQVMYTLFRTPTRIARVRSVEYLQEPGLFSPSALPIDVLISPEQIVSDYILRVIEHPGALQVLDFAEGKVRLVGLRAYYGGPLVSHQLRELRQRMKGADARVAAIYRKGRAIKPEGETVIEAEDEVFFIAASRNIRRVMSELRRSEKTYRRIIIAGGGNIGMRLARALQDNYRVKVIEREQKIAQRVSERLTQTIVLHGDAADGDLLLEENIENTDVFIAVTNDEEANILSAMLAKRLGARKVMSLINRPAYVDLVEDTGQIDIAISPQQATIGSLLTHVRQVDVSAVHSLRKGAAEAIEAVAHGDSNSSRVVGRRIDELHLPEGVSIGAIVRGEEVIIAHHDTRIEAEDHVILFLVNKSKVNEVVRLFQVGITFV
ncbi:MAG: Trk system potassium transporter TrkA [Gammaproteobacteria bacterium SHHR-1]|uniref:Trk system potassium transporter TrkA n=1 Tax=Magnetovirga frankeli TaxID=947516 RepID=UPI001292E83F|nr:Trk system potassium transporter TrkA [gamma proteobacterium SS-5]